MMNHWSSRRYALPLCPFSVLATTGLDVLRVHRTARIWTSSFTFGEPGRSIAAALPLQALLRGTATYNDLTFAVNMEAFLAETTFLSHKEVVVVNLPRLLPSPHPASPAASQSAVKISLQLSWLAPFQSTQRGGGPANPSQYQPATPRLLHQPTQLLGGRKPATRTPDRPSTKLRPGKEAYPIIQRYKSLVALETYILTNPRT
ncbi:hypothetical protein BDV06DRAFT_24482 [Aspergillus oleicola]